MPHSVNKLALLLLPEFSNFGLTAVTEPLFVANWLSQQPLFEWKTVSADGQPVRASSGAQVPVDGDLLAAADCDAVFVFASFEPSATIRNHPVIRWLKRMARAGVELGGIENGSLALAEAGLLDAHPAAVHWDNLTGFEELYPKIRVARELYSFSRNRMTCAGAAAILDMMIVWIGHRSDPGLARNVAKHLLLTPVRGVAEDDGIVARARALMQANIDEPLPCEKIAVDVRLSLRQLERRFKHVTGRSVNREYMLVRVEKAHQYLQQTALSVTEVSVLTGFRSVEYFSKVYRRTFGCRPSDDRRQSTNAPVFPLTGRGGG